MRINKCNANGRKIKEDVQKKIRKKKYSRGVQAVGRVCRIAKKDWVQEKPNRVGLLKGLGLTKLGRPSSIKRVWDKF